MHISWRTGSNFPKKNNLSKILLSIYQNVFDWANQEDNLLSAMKMQCGLFEVEEDFTYIIVIFRNKFALYCACVYQQQNTYY